MKPVFISAASLVCLLLVAGPSLAAPTHPLRNGEIAADPQTVASLTHGPDMITRAGSSQKAARADLESGSPAIAGTVTALKWRHRHFRED